MSNEKHYPLHPGQDHVPPYYVQVPQSEYESLKRENEQLHALLQGTPKQSATAEIDTLTSEVKALRDMNVKLQGQKIQLEEDVALLSKNNKELKEERRWRNFSEEKPDDKQWILVYVENPSKYGTYIELRRWDVGCKFDVEDQELYMKWMPKPKAPEGA